jgi:hypothetical protein
VPDQAQRDAERAWLEWQDRYQQTLAVMSTSGDAGPSKLDADRDIVASSQVFDVDWYVSTYPDVAASGVDPAFHFVRHGAGEGRHPGPDFDTKAYVANHAEVVALGLNPVVHFVRGTDTGSQGG